MELRFQRRQGTPSGSGETWSQVVRANVTPVDRLDKSKDMASLVQPTITFRDKLTLHLAGLELEVLHAPGETEDQVIVWYPERRTLFPADNIYKAFPNL